MSEYKDKSDRWASPADDSQEPDETYNDYTSKSNDDKTDELLLNSGYLKPVGSSNTTNKKPIKKSFKERWGETDELCPTCGAVTKEVKGLTRQNIKRLLSFRFDSQSLIIFFLMCMALAFAYTTYIYMTSSINCSNVTNIIDPSLNKDLLNTQLYNINLTGNITNVGAYSNNGTFDLDNTGTVLVKVINAS